MSNIEQYRDGKADKQDHYSQEYPHSECFKVGFDAAIELDLAVKFYHWYYELGCVFYSTPEEGYKHWIANVFKID